MRSRPWPIVILAVLYILGPVFNVIAGMMVMKISPGQYLHALFAHATVWSMFKLLALYPVAGLAIYAVKEWSYPVYLLIMAFANFLNFMDWRHYSRVFTLPIFLGTVVINMVLVGYFLIPAVRVAYFNKRLRWWESKPRYDVDLEGTVQLQGADPLPCRIQNLSEGGAFLTCDKTLEINSNVTFVFNILNRQLTLDSKVVHVRPGNAGYGLQFHHTDETDAQMRRVAKSLELLGHRPRIVNPKWTDSLREWVVTLFKTGKGLIPEVPAQTLAKKSPETTTAADSASKG